MEKINFYEAFSKINDKLSFWLKTSLIWTIANSLTWMSILWMTFSTGNSESNILLIIFFLSIPFGLFPSTQVLFCITRDLIVNEKQNTSSLRENLFQFWKINYKRSVSSGLIFSVIGVLIFLNVVLLNASNYLFQSFFILLGLILFTVVVSYFSFQSHYYLSLKEIITNSFVFTFAKLKYTLKLMAVLGIFSVVSIFIPILIFFFVSVLVYILFLIFYKELELEK